MLHRTVNLSNFAHVLGISGADCLKRKKKKKAISYLVLRVLMPVPISVSHVHGFLEAEFHHCGRPGSQSCFFCSRSAGLRFCLFCAGVGRTTALQTGSSSPGCHGSWKLLRGVCCNPTGRSCALVYLCIGNGLGEMKAAKVGKRHPPLWLGNIWCVLTPKHSDSVQAAFTRRPTHRFKGFFLFVFFYPAD